MTELETVDDFSVLHDETNQFLCFELANEKYGIDILKIQEIRGWQSATQVPDLPPEMVGIWNLRGDVVPLLDLRQRFSLSKAVLEPTSVVIIVMIQMDRGAKPVGLIVDAVAKVLTTAHHLIKPVPEMGGLNCPEYLKGLIDDEESMVMLLDVDSLLNDFDLAGLEVTQE